MVAGLVLIDQGKEVQAAYYDGWTEVTASTKILTTGNYVVKENVTIQGARGQSGLTVNGKVTLYIAEGKTLMVTGGAGSGQNTGGGAGIELPKGASLSVYGKGSIKATGGAGGAPTEGEKGTDPGGIMSSGGYGGAGAGAGIGGKGGTGGAGGSNESKNGSSGNAGGSMGSFYVYDSVIVVPKGGMVTRSGQTAAGSPNTNGGGGGGGGGGAGYDGANVGAGGAGGGGGGAGASSYLYNGCGGGGGGGQGSLGGVGGKPGWYVSSTAYNNGASGQDGSFGSGGNGGKGGRIFREGDPGGNGGSTAYKTAVGGTICVASTASAAFGEVSHTNSASRVAMTKITLDNDGGSANQSMEAVSESPLPSMDTTLPTKEGFDFQGYFSGVGGTGTQYINADGTSTGTNWNTSHRTLYAFWKATEYALTFDLDGVTGVSVTGATVVGDGTYKAAAGTSITVAPSGMEGDKVFVGWYGDDSAYSSSEATYTFAMPKKALHFTATAMKGVWVEDTITLDPSDFKVESKYAAVDVEVHLNGVKKHMGAVTLVDADGNEIKMGGSDGSYTYTNILDLTGKEYEVYVDGNPTGEKVSFADEAGQAVQIDYYSLTIDTTLNGVPYDPGNIQLVEKSDPHDTLDLFFDSDQGNTYYTTLKDPSKEYKLYINGEDTKETVVFDKENQFTFAYHSIGITTKLDGVLKDMGEVTLQKDADTVNYTLSGGNGTYEIVALDDQEYHIYISGKDTKKTITFGDTAEINYYTVAYQRSDGSVLGTMPADATYLEGTTMQVPGQGNLTKDKHHFAGWNDGTTTYFAGGEVLISGAMILTDMWEGDVDPQARWTTDGGATWQTGTYADAVDVTWRTPGALTVEFLKDGSLPPQKEATIGSNKVWTILSNVAFEIPATTKVINQGTMTNAGVISGGGTIANRAALHNEAGTVKVPAIDNTDGVLYGGTYGSIEGEHSSRVIITGGQAKSTQTDMFILGDYSTMKDVAPADGDTWISVMGKTLVDGAPTEDQLTYHFGGMAVYDTAANAVKLKGNLHFRDEITFQDAVLDPGDNNTGGITMPMVYAEAVGLKDKQYSHEVGGTVKIVYGTSASTPGNKTDMVVPNGADITLHGAAEAASGYEFKGWYENPIIDADGSIIDMGTKVSNTQQYQVAGVSADRSFYALFEQKNYALTVATDSASTATVDNGEGTEVSLIKSETKQVSASHGGVLTIAPAVISDTDYSFFGYFKNYEDGQTETIVQTEKVPDDPTWTPPDNWDGTYPADVPTSDVPMLVPYTTESATTAFDYEVTILTLVKGMLHYNLAGGTFPAGAVADQDVKLITDQPQDVTLTVDVPEKQGYQFVGWNRIDTNDPYDSGDTISLTGAQANRGVTFVAIYEKDKDAKFWADTQGYKTLDAAVAATQTPGSGVEGVSEILFDDGTAITLQTGDIYGTLPDGYTLRPETGKAAMVTVKSNKTLQIGNETTDNTDNSSTGTWKTGAKMTGMDLVCDGGQVKLDGQRSSIEEGKVILLPDNQLQLVSDLNTGNLVKIELWDAKDTPADVAASLSWTKNKGVVISDADDGDSSPEDGTDTTYNLMAGRVRILNEGYSVYHKETVSTVTGGTSVRIVPTKEVKAMRTPRADVNLTYSDPLLVYEYISIQDAIHAAAKENAGGMDQAEQNQIYLVSDSAEDIQLYGDDPSLPGSSFADYLDQTYCSALSLIAGTRTAGNNGTIQVAPGGQTRKLSGNITVKDVTLLGQPVGTNWKLDDLLVTGTVSLEEQSQMEVTTRKSWGNGEAITLSPVKDVAGKITNKRILVEGTPGVEAHFKLQETLKTEGYKLDYEDPYVRVQYMGGPVVITEDIKDAVTIPGGDYAFEAKATYATGVSDDPAVTDEEYQGFTYQWQRQKKGAATWENLDADKSEATFKNGAATLRYESTEVTGDTEYVYRCQVWNVTNQATGVIPNTRSAKLTVETEPGAFVSIPADIRLKKEKEETYIGNTQTSEADTSNLIRLLTQPDATIPAGTFKIQTEPTFEITLNGDPNPEDYKYRKYVIDAYQGDGVTPVGADKVLMELQEGVLEKSRFYLQAPLDKTKMDGVYKGVMTFAITYQSGGNP